MKAVAVTLLLLLTGCVHCERAGPIGPVVCES